MLDTTRQATTRRVRLRPRWAGESATNLTIGLPGRSNALLIAQRLGLPQPIIDSAKGEINPEDLRADKLLDDIRKERNRTSRERQKLEKARDKLETQTKEIEKRLEKIEDERREVLAKARAEGELEVAVLRKNIDSLKSQLKKAKQPLEAIRIIEEKIEKIEEKVEAPVERKSDQISVVSGQSVETWRARHYQHAECRRCGDSFG